MSDLMYLIFLIPKSIQGVYTDFWMIDGLLGQASCKLVFYLTQASGLVSVIKPGSDSSGSIWSCGISSPFSTHRFKSVPVLHSHHFGSLQWL